MNAFTPGDILQVEPLLHRECAAISTCYCPSLKRDIANGTIAIRQVFLSSVQIAIADPEFLHLYAPDYPAKPTDRIASHAKVWLKKWRERDLDWLGGAS